MPTLNRYGETVVKKINRTETLSVQLEAEMVRKECRRRGNGRSRRRTDAGHVVLAEAPLLWACRRGWTRNKPKLRVSWLAGDDDIGNV